jgi:hypothetical protein
MGSLGITRRRPWSLAHQQRRLHPLPNTPRDHGECRSRWTVEWRARGLPVPALREEALVDSEGDLDLAPVIELSQRLLA